MENQTVHEPNEKLMGVEEVWEDAQQVAQVLHREHSVPEPVVRLSIPLSVFVSALEQFNHEELMIVRQRIEEQLAA